MTHSKKGVGEKQSVLWDEQHTNGAQEPEQTERTEVASQWAGSSLEDTRSSFKSLQIRMVMGLGLASV